MNPCLLAFLVLGGLYVSSKLVIAPRREIPRLTEICERLRRLR